MPLLSNITRDSNNLLDKAIMLVIIKLHGIPNSEMLLC